MKMKLTMIALGASLFASAVSMAQEPGKDSEQSDHFAEHKTQMVKDLNDEKSGLDQVLSCVNSAQKRDDMKKCYDLKKANMEKIRERNRAEKKERLQNELKKLDEESSKDSKK